MVLPTERSRKNNTDGVRVEMEQRRAEELGALPGDLDGARPVVGQRHVVEGRHSGHLRRHPDRRGEPREWSPSHPSPLHLLVRTHLKNPTNYAFSNEPWYYDIYGSTSNVNWPEEPAQENLYVSFSSISSSSSLPLGVALEGEQVWGGRLQEPGWEGVYNVAQPAKKHSCFASKYLY
jgi:hypothetical protein